MSRPLSDRLDFVQQKSGKQQHIALALIDFEFARKDRKAATAVAAGIAEKDQHRQLAVGGLIVGDVHMPGGCLAGTVCDEVGNFDTLDLKAKMRLINLVSGLHQALDHQSGGNLIQQRTAFPSARSTPLGMLRCVGIRQHPALTTRYNQPCTLVRTKQAFEQIGSEQGWIQG